MCKEVDERSTLERDYNDFIRLTKRHSLFLAAEKSSIFQTFKHRIKSVC